MKRIRPTAYFAAALIGAGLIWAHTGSAAMADDAETASLTLTVSGLSPQTGAVMVGVYAGEPAWDAGDAAAGRRIEVTSETLSVTIDGLEPGAYGLKLYHDVDGDGRMNTNLMGIPTEPVVFSNNAPMRFGPAQWDDATFVLTAGNNAHAVVFN